MTLVAVLLSACTLAWSVAMGLSRTPLRAGWAAWMAAALYGAVAFASYLLAQALVSHTAAMGFYLLLCVVLWSNMLALEHMLLGLVGSQRSQLRAGLLLGLPLRATLGPVLRDYLAQRLGLATAQRWRQYGLGLGFWALWLWLAGDLLPLPWVLAGLLYYALCAGICFTISAMFVVQFWLSARHFPRAR